MSQILSVQELTSQLKQLLEGKFPYVWVRGEVTNLTRPSSGHLYFGLKDGQALLRCVWFRGRQRDQEAFDPLTGEVFAGGPRPSLALALKNGQQLVCAGQLSLYSPRGEYQLVVDLAQGSGEGALFLALEALKRKLEAKGYFRLERKRTLPEHPCRVAVITAPRGAAIHDFVRLASERGIGFQLRIHPVPVQGDEAAPHIAEAIRQENEKGWAEVLVLIRGGGSLQDLWAFNEEAVADAVFASRIPVLAGIGHEVDTCLADMTADVRAATPSHAAQILWPERSWYAQRVDEMEMRVQAAFSRHLGTAVHKLDGLEDRLPRFAPAPALARKHEGLTRLTQALCRARQRYDAFLDQRLAALEKALLRLGSFPMLRYRQEQGAALAQRLDLAMRRKSLEAANALAAAERSLQTSEKDRLLRAERLLERLGLRLSGLDPTAPLRQGYTLAFSDEGRVVRSVRDLEPGSLLTIKTHDGEADTRVTAVRLSGD